VGTVTPATAAISASVVRVMPHCPLPRKVAQLRQLVWTVDLRHAAL
jgi:hypothetical protein